MKIALDIDDVLADFMGAYKEFFNTNKYPNRLQSATITKNVQSLRKNKVFWTSLRVINKLNFEPELYCTKRVNSKRFTKEWLISNGFPNKPVYQVYNQSANKAERIKGRCDVLVDDSYFNVIKSMESGLPALLYTTPENQNYDFPYRINSLTYEEIERVYNKLINEIRPI